MTTTIERKYQLTRIKPGDYLLPSNDARTLWRIHRYEETGSLSYIDGDGRERFVTGTFWGVARYRGTPEQFTADLDGWDDPLSWGSNWEHYSDGYSTRADAISDALSH